MDRWIAGLCLGAGAWMVAIAAAVPPAIATESHLAAEVSLVAFRPGAAHLVGLAVAVACFVTGLAVLGGWERGRLVGPAFGLLAIVPAAWEPEPGLLPASIALLALFLAAAIVPRPSEAAAPPESRWTHGIVSCGSAFFVVVCWTVVPRFERDFAALGAELPFLTALLLDVTDLAVWLGFALPWILVGAAVPLLALRRHGNRVVRTSCPRTSCRVWMSERCRPSPSASCSSRS